MVFFFSATGNSEWIARMLASKFDLPLVRINKYTESEQNVSGSRYIIFVFPVHSWGPAIPVLSFVSKLHLLNYQNQPIYAVCTCGDDCGRTDTLLQKHLNGYKVKAVFSVTMPNTYIILPGFNVDTKSIEQQKLEKANHRLKLIIDEISNEQETTNLYHSGGMAKIKTFAIYPLFRLFVKGKTSFHTTDSCTSCGLCAKICPTGNITIQNDKKPAWDGNCVQCLACIHRCPASAIEYGNRTSKKGRYTNPLIYGNHKKKI